MKLDVATVTDEQSLEDVVGLMLRRNLKRIPVVRDGTPIGVVARHDLLRAVATRLRGAGGDGRVSESSVPSTV
jgi:CBS domain-containing protein